MSNISIKEATMADADEYLELERKVGGRTYFATRSKDEFLEKLNKRKIYLFLQDNKMFGHISVVTREDGGVYFSNFAIDPEYQGKGYAREIIELTRDIIRDKIKDAPRFEAATHPDNLKAIHLYESLGFKITGRKENYCGDGQPRLILEKDNK